MIHVFLNLTPGEGLELLQKGTPEELYHDKAERDRTVVALMGAIQPCWQIYIVTDRDRERRA